MNGTIRLVAGLSSTGKPVYEEVLVESLGAGCYRLIRSPGLVLGLAADDEFEVGDDGTFEVLERGGNLCLQVFVADRDDAGHLRRALEEEFEPLAGRIDGHEKNVVVLTVPVDRGFSAIEAAVRAAVSKVPQSEWYFGNVYDPSDGVTPLNWWL